MWRMNSRRSIHFMENGNHLFIVFGQLFVLSLKLFFASPHREAKKRMDFERSEQDISFIAFNQEVWNRKVFRCVSFHSTNIHTEFWLKRLDTFPFGTNDYGAVISNKWNCVGKLRGRHVDVVEFGYFMLYYTFVISNQFYTIE